MVEFEPVIIFKGSKTERKTMAEIKPLADEEIAEAGALFKRNAQGKENPLDREEKNRLEELTRRIKEEEDALFPKFSFEKIIGFGTPSEASADFEVAERYFKKVAELAKTPLNSYNMPEGIYNLALKLEKLKNWDKDPKRIEKVFINQFLERHKSMFELNKKASEEKKDTTSLSRGMYFGKKLWDKMRSGKISEMDMKKLNKFIDIERGHILLNMPDHLREAVIYVPQLAEEAINRTRKIYQMQGRQKKYLKERIILFNNRVREFEDFKKQ